MAHILIADDDPSLVLMLSNHLERLDHSVRHARDGLECFQLAKESRPDLLIVDIMMPGLDGFQVVQKIRELGHEYRRIPIIIMSVKEKLDFLFRGLNIQSFIAKPFSLDEFMICVSEALEQANKPDGEF